MKPLTLALLIGLVALLVPVTVADSAEYTVTSYCPGRCCCGPKARGVTASGVRVKYPMIAAPKSIPFGTVLHVPGYGTATVTDRGGAIKAGRLDVYYPTHAQALRFGKRHHVQVTVVRAGARVRAVDSHSRRK